MASRDDLVYGPTILALDFDGVICDGLREYFQTAWRAYCLIWQSDSQQIPPGLAAEFYRLRPVVETGWEMPLLLHALRRGIAADDILLEWATIADHLITSERIQPAEIGAVVDDVRDRWIAADLEGWLAEHRFYPGIIAQLRDWVANGTTGLVIISTKEGRFIRQLLEQQQVFLPEHQIIGKEAKRPKHQILRELRAEYIQTASFWFVEDRLKTLLSVKEQLDLDAVGLYLADWGYNLERERQLAEQDDRIDLLSLDQFSQPFTAWKRANNYTAMTTDSDS